MLKLPRTLLVHLALLMATLAIGIGFVATKAILSDVSAPAWACVRITAAGVLFALGLGTMARRVTLTRAEQVRVAACALLGIVANQACFAFGLRHTTAVHAALLNGLVPLLTMAWACGLGREVWRAPKLLAMGLAFVGVWNLYGAALTGLTWNGDGLMLVNSACYALYLVISRDLFRRHGWQVIVPSLFAWAIPGILPIGLVPALHVHWAAISPTTWALMLFVILGPSIGSYIGFGWALQRMEASTAATYGYVQPLAAVLVAHLWLGEPITARLVGSMGLIFAGLGLAILTGTGSPVPFGRLLQWKRSLQQPTVAMPVA